MIVREYQLGNAEIRIYRPKLTDAERERRERRILTTLQQVGRSIAETRRDTNGNMHTTRDFGEKRILD